MKKIWDIFEEEEKEKPIGWSQRMRDIGEIPETKPKSPVWDMFTVDVGVGAGAKATGELTLPEKTKPEEDFSTPLGKIQYYKSKIDWLEGIAKEKGGLGGSGYDAYRYAIEQYNKAVKEYNVNLPEKQVDFGISGPMSLPSEKPKTVLEATGYKMPTKPEELKMGIETTLGTWEEQKKANPELQKTEDLAREVLNMRGINSSHEHAQIAYIYELLTTTETEAGVPMEETIKDIQSNLEKYGNINPPKDWKKAFKEEGVLKTALIGPSDKYGQAESVRRGFIDIITKKQSPGADLISSMGWKGMILFLGAQTVAGLMNITPEIWKQLNVKVANKKISFKEGLEAVMKTGHGEGTVYQREIYNEAIKQADAQNISVVNMLKKGVTLTEVTPRFAFGAKLYGGLPADAMVKSMVETGKITTDIARELSLAKPELVSQVIQQLSIASPAIASKLAPKLVELIPQVKEEVKPELKSEEPAETPKVEGKEPVELKIGDKVKFKKLFADIPEGAEAEVTKVTIPEKGQPIISLYFGKNQTGQKITRKYIPLDVLEKTQPMPPKPIITEEKPPLKKVEEVKEEEVAKAEAIAPTKVELTEKEEIKKVIEIKNETEKAQKKLIDEKVLELKEEGFKGVEKGGLKKDEEGKVIGRYPAVSKNPKWYRDFYAENKTKPTLLDLKEIAKDQLLHGHEEDYGPVPPNEIYQKLDSQIESYNTIIDTLKALPKPPPTPALPPEKAVPPAEKAKVEPTPKAVPKPYDLKKDLTTEQKIEGNKLIGKIQGSINAKGLTKTESAELKRQFGGSPHLATATRRMTIPQLEAVLQAVEKARPKQIGWQKVITPKTEKKILSLKENLIEKLQMTEEAYQEVLKDVGVYKEPKYIDGKHFITEKQGKDVIYRLIDEANILKVTMPYDKAVAENKPIKSEVDKIDKRIKAVGEGKAKDPHELVSMRLYIQAMEIPTGAPFYPLYQDLINTHLENKQKLGQFIKGFEPYKEIIKDDKELKKVNDYIVAKSTLKDKPPVPDNMTDKEIRLAKKIEGILTDYEAKARTEKFLDNIDNLKGIPQYEQYKTAINKAKDIYESKGYDDLVEYMKTQEWGIIRSGYSPLQVISPKVRIYKPKAQTFGKTHIKVRTDMEYHEQDRNIIQRLFSYKKQMDNLVGMRPKVRALITLVDKNVSKFKDPDRIVKNMEIFFRELKGYNRPENWFDRSITCLYAQAMQTIIMPSPVLSGRNLLQNIAFGHDKSLLIDPRNKKLTPDELDYFNTYVSQIEAMKTDWLMVGEKPLPGLGILTKMVRKISIYPYSDLANRHWGYWAKINQVKRAFAGDKSLDRKMKAAKFSDMESIEQKMALQILAKDGEEAMARYVARVYVDNTQFLYDRSQRSPAEMTRIGRLIGNLMLFPRAYWEMLYKQSRKMTGKYVPGRERIRAFKVLASVIAGGILVGAAYKKVTGRRENPYNPIDLLAYEPGGLALGTLESVTDVYVNTLMASKGDERAAAALTTAIPQAADMFVPFYAYITRALEASTDTKNIDRLALRKLRMMIDKEYEARGGAYVLEREAMEKWQYFLSGAGIDVDIKEREAEKKKTPLSDIWAEFKTKKKSKSDIWATFD